MTPSLVTPSIFIDSKQNADAATLWLPLSHGSTRVKDIAQRLNPSLGVSTENLLPRFVKCLPVINKAHPPTERTPRVANLPLKTKSILTPLKTNNGTPPTNDRFPVFSDGLSPNIGGDWSDNNGSSNESSGLKMGKILRRQTVHRTLRGIFPLKLLLFS